MVIPVKVTGGAACGKFNVPDKIFKVGRNARILRFYLMHAITALIVEDKDICRFQ